MRKFLPFCFVLILASCAHHREVVIPTVDAPYLAGRLNELSRLQSAGQFDAMKSFFSKSATIQSPVTPRRASVDKYLHAAATDRYALSFSQTEIIYSLPGKVTTRSLAHASSPERFNLNESVMIDWRFEGGQWLITRFAFPDWPPVIGVWRRSGQHGEGSIELRVMPGGVYVIYLNEDYTLPAFRGHYDLSGNQITFTDTTAEDPKMFERGDGTYVFTKTSSGANFNRIRDDSNWRSERFDGAWVSWE